jgi:hypothetical protein
MMGSIASLDLGEAWIWEPGADLFQRVKIRERRTFNSSATPKSGDTPLQAVKLAKVDLEKLRDQIAATIAAVDENDPAKLRERIRELEKLSSKPQVETREIKVPTLSKDDIHALKVAADEMMAVSVRITESLNRWIKPAEEDLKHISVGYDPAKIGGLKYPKPDNPLFNPIIPLRAEQTAIDIEPPKITGGAQRMLNVLGARYPMTFTRPQLAALTKMSPKSGTFGTYMSLLRSNGLIDLTDGQISLTEAGRAQADSTTATPQTSAEVIDMWRSVFTGGARRMFDRLTEAYPAGLTREELGQWAGISPSSGTFGTYLSQLKRTGVVGVSGSEIKASDVLFQ